MDKLLLGIVFCTYVSHSKLIENPSEVIHYNFIANAGYNDYVPTYTLELFSKKVRLFVRDNFCQL